MSIFRRNKTNGSKHKNKSLGTDKAITIQAALAQSVGKTRLNMEDAASSLVWEQGFRDDIKRMGLFIVADGMGGHLNGEMASSIAIQQVNAHLVSLLQSQNSEIPTTEEVQKLLTEAFDMAQKAVVDEVNGGGSTLTLALVIDRMLYWAHVGDSRLYLLNLDGEGEALTNDHSLVQRLVDLGQISAKEAEIHPQKSVLYRALGQTDHFKSDFGFRELEEVSRLIICSDGLWGVLDEKKIFDEVSSAKSLDEKANHLCELANKAGGPDNISVILVEIS